MSHFEISGNFFKDVHLQNNPGKTLQLCVSHLDMSGNSFNDEHS